VDFPIKNGEYFHSYVSLPEGTMGFPEMGKKIGGKIGHSYG
jgi:hypothetical protein